MNRDKDSLELRVQKLEKENESLKLQLKNQNKITRNFNLLEEETRQLRIKYEEAQEAREIEKTIKEKFKKANSSEELFDVAMQQLNKYINSEDISIYLRDDTKYTLLCATNPKTAHSECSKDQAKTMEIINKQGTIYKSFNTHTKSELKYSELNWYMGTVAKEDDTINGNKTIVVNTLRHLEEDQNINIIKTTRLLETITSELLSNLNIQELKKRITTDETTGLVPQSRTKELIPELFSNVKRRKNEKHTALVFLDLDDFKIFNDRFTHKMGDEVLKKAGLAIKESCRDKDFKGRYAGDEFFLALPGIDTRLDAYAVIKRLREKLSETTLDKLIADTFGTNSAIKQEFDNRLVLTGMEKLVSETQVKTTHTKEEKNKIIHDKIDELVVKIYNEYNTPHILIVDDEKATRELLQTKLELDPRFEDYKIELASNAREALEKYSEKKYCAVISDYNMPEITGLDFLSQIKDGETIKILLTGEELDKTTILRAKPIDFYLNKEETLHETSKTSNTRFDEISEKIKSNFQTKKIPQTYTERRDQLTKLKINLASYLNPNEREYVNKSDYAQDTTIQVSISILLTSEVNEHVSADNLVQILSTASKTVKAYKPEQYVGFVRMVEEDGTVHTDSISDDELEKELKIQSEYLS